MSINNHTYLPSSEDWSFWFKLAKEVGVDLSSDHDLKLIPSDHTRYMIIFARQILQNFPTLRQELIEEICDDGLVLFSEYEKVSISDDHIDTKEGNNRNSWRTFINDVRSLEVREKPYSKIPLVKSNSIKSWENEFKIIYDKEINSKKNSTKINKREIAYCLTGAGAISYELTLCLPILSLSLFGYKRGYSIGDFFINYGILSNNKRFKWKRSFLEENDYICNGFHLTIFDEMNTYLKGKEELFWNMTQPHILLIREIYNLELLIEIYEKEIINSKDERVILKKVKKINASDKNILKYETSTESNYINSYKIAIQHAKILIDNFLFPELKKFNISKNDYEKSKPSEDIFRSQTIRDQK